MHTPIAIFVTVGIVAALAAPSDAKDITRCGQSLAKHEVGVLQNDLDCPSTPGSCRNDDAIACTTDADCPVTPNALDSQCLFDGLRLEKSAHLQLNGHTLTSSDPSRPAISTNGMTIDGPGTIVAPGGVAILLGGSGKLVLRNLVVRDSHYGIYVNSKGSIDATNVSVLDNGGMGLGDARKLTGSNITVSGNGFDTGLPPGSIYGFGVGAKTVRVDGLTAQNNVGPGVFADSLRLENSTISGNNGFQAGVDIAIERKPRLEATTCGVSGRLSKTDELIGTWGVCGGD